MRNEQRVVWAIREATYFMAGDPDHKPSGNDGQALPKLLKDGWTIKSVHPFAAMKPDDLVPVAHFILEKGAY